MAVLGGHFTMVLILEAPADADVSTLRQGVEEAGRRLELDVLTLSEIPRLEASVVEPTHVVTVYGADHVGIVHSVTDALASRDVNITDLSTRVLAGQDDQPLYVMQLEVASGDVDVEAALSGVRTEQGVEVSVRPLERDVL
jgi:glycine cleavage system transcriptional repressor